MKMTPPAPNNPQSAPSPPWHRSLGPGIPTVAAVDQRAFSTLHVHGSDTNCITPYPTSLDFFALLCVPRWPMLYV